MDSQTPVARDNVTLRELESEIIISGPSSVFPRVTEEKEGEEERTAPPSSPCHGRITARQILKKTDPNPFHLTVAARVCAYMFIFMRDCYSLRVFASKGIYAY